MCGDTDRFNKEYVGVESIVSLIVFLEVIGFWMLLFYNTDREAYMVNLTIGAGIMLIMVGIFG